MCVACVWNILYCICKDFFGVYVICVIFVCVVYLRCECGVFVIGEGEPYCATCILFMCVSSV